MEEIIVYACSTFFLSRYKGNHYKMSNFRMQSIFDVMQTAVIKVEFGVDEWTDHRIYDPLFHTQPQCNGNRLADLAAEHSACLKLWTRSAHTGFQ